MKKKVLALLLTTMMVIGAVGCGQEATGSADNTDTSKTETQTENASSDTAGTSETVAEVSDYDFSDREHVTMKVYMFGDADTEQAEAVSKAVSEITNKKLNCDVELTRIGFGSYVTQMNLLLSSGEQVDIFPLFTLSLTSLANAGQIHPITDILPEYGAQTLNSVSDSDWACGSVAGDIYAFIPNKDKAADLGFIMRKDIVDELGVNVDDIKDFNDLHDVLVKVKEAYPDMYPVVPDFKDARGLAPVDTLGDNFGVLLDPYNSDSLTVENYFTSDIFKEICQTSYDWAKEGLIMPDASSNTEAGNNLMKTGKGFGRFSHMKVGFEEETEAAVGRDLVCWRYKEPLSYTSKLSSSLWCVSETSVDYDRAVALLNLMYTDPELSTLFIDGIEGVHYEYKADGSIGYPEGKDAATVGYARQAWGWPNEQITPVWEGDSATLWEELNAFNESAKQSPAKGFVFDNSAVLNEVTAVTNVYDKYYQALLAGQLDPETTIPVFVEEMDNAGLQTIIAEKQRQLDEWAATK